MPTGQTSTDIEQNGRDTNVLSWYLDGNPELEPIENYGRLGKLLYLLVTSLLNGTVFRYGGRVDSVEDLPETGTPNEFYFVGPEDSENYDEYIWVVNEEEEHGGHWDRVGSVSIIIDDHLDPQSTNSVQNSVITLAINGLAVSLAAGYDTDGVYEIGSYCTRGQTLYKSLAEQNPAGTWDSSKWQSVTVMGELTSAISGLATVASTGDYNDLTNKPTFATVATSGNYNDLTNKPDIPTVSDRLKSIAAAAAFDPSGTYTTGDYMTLDGELYRCDPNGSAIVIGDNLLGTYSERLKNSSYGYVDNKFCGSDGFYTTADTFYASGTIPLTSNASYRIVTPSYTKYNNKAAACALSSYENGSSPIGNPNTIIAYSSDGSAKTFDITATKPYLILSVYKANESSYAVYAVSSAKFVKTTIAAELGTKANSSDIPDAVTVTNTGDVYIGTQLIRKVLTQAEYDLLDPPDPKVDYLIVSAST